MLVVALAGRGGKSVASNGHTTKPVSTDLSSPPPDMTVAQGVLGPAPTCVVVGVVVKHSQRELRALVRRTWALFPHVCSTTSSRRPLGSPEEDAFRATVKRMFPTRPRRCLTMRFVVGTPFLESARAELAAENEAHGDMVVLPVPERRNAAGKLMAFYG